MESFCHRLNKPSGSLCVKVDESYLLLTIVLEDKVFSIDVNHEANPQAKKLLKPCKKLEVFQQRDKITLQVDGEDLIKNKTAETVSPREALQQMTEPFCTLSKRHAEVLNKRRDAKDIKNEAFECLQKLDDQRQEDFTKLILILNEKKRKIRELKRKLGIHEDDPDDVEDDIDIQVLDDSVPDAKKSRLSDQLALEGPSASKRCSKTQEKDASDVEPDEVVDIDDEEDFVSEDEHSEGAASEVEEIDEDGPLQIETKPKSEKLDDVNVSDEIKQIAAEAVKKEKVHVAEKEKVDAAEKEKVGVAKKDEVDDAKKVKVDLAKEGTVDLIKKEIKEDEKTDDDEDSEYAPPRASVKATASFSSKRSALDALDDLL